MLEEENDFKMEHFNALLSVFIDNCVVQYHKLHTHYIRLFKTPNTSTKLFEAKLVAMHFYYFLLID